MNKLTQDRKYKAIDQHFLTQLELVKVLPQILGLRNCCSSGKFVHEMNLAVFSTITNYIRLKGEVNFFIREFWKSFTFLVT